MEAMVKFGALMVDSAINEATVAIVDRLLQKDKLTEDLAKAICANDHSRELLTSIEVVNDYVVAAVSIQFGMRGSSLKQFCQDSKNKSRWQYYRAQCVEDISLSLGIATEEEVEAFNLAKYLKTVLKRLKDNGAPASLVEAIAPYAIEAKAAD